MTRAMGDQSHHEVEEEEILEIILANKFSKFIDLDDSRHVMKTLDKERAQAMGESCPAYKPRAKGPVSKKKMRKRENRSS